MRTWAEVEALAPATDPEVHDLNRLPVGNNGQVAIAARQEQIARERLTQRAAARPPSVANDQRTIAQLERRVQALEAFNGTLVSELAKGLRAALPELIRRKTAALQRQVVDLEQRPRGLAYKGVLEGRYRLRDGRHDDLGWRRMGRGREPDRQAR